MPDSAVSIVLCAHAPYARFIPDSLGSILAQSYGSLHVHVLSDGSEEVGKAGAEFSRDSRGDVVCQGAPPLLLAATDCLKKAQGEYLASWNSDDIYRKHHVQPVADVLEQNP